MIYYGFIDLPFMIVMCILAFVIGYALGIAEKKRTRENDYWRGYTDCKNEGNEFKDVEDEE